MKSAITSIEETIKALKIEKRMWEKQTAPKADIIENVETEIKEHEEALKVLTGKSKHQNELSDDIDYLFSKINWGKSFLDARAVEIMNTLKNKILNR